VRKLGRVSDSIADPPAVPGRAPDKQDPSPAFKDLAAARFLSQTFARGRGNPNNELLHRDYDVLRKRFEAEEGHIEREYWADYAPMAVVVTGKPRGRILRMLGLSPRFALHRSTEAASLPFELESALADGDTLATTAAVVLNGGAAVTVLNRVFEAHKFLLSAVDAEMYADRNWPLAIRRALRAQDGSEEAAPPEPIDETMIATPQPSTAEAS
jgi:hypothetical protein